MAKTKHLSSVYVGIVIAVVCLALVIVFKPETATGSAVYVKYHGVSDQPLAEEAGKIQTYVKLTQSTLRGIVNKGTETDKEVADNIMGTADFAHGLVDIYEINPPAPVQSAELNTVMNAANILAKNFRVETGCIQKIGNIHNSKKEFEFVVVTELLYSECDSQYKVGETWLGAKARHTFYELDGEFICTQESYNLFTINKEIGQISAVTNNC